MESNRRGNDPQAASWILALEIMDNAVENQRKNSMNEKPSTAITQRRTETLLHATSIDRPAPSTGHMKSTVHSADRVRGMNRQLVKLKQVATTAALLLFSVSGILRAGDVKVKRTVETEVVRLTWSGFEPSRLERPQGAFRLFVQAVGMDSSFTYVLENESKAALKAETLKKGSRQRFLEELALSPGTYVLKVAEHPKLTLQVVVR